MKPDVSRPEFSIAQNESHFEQASGRGPADLEEAVREAVAAVHDPEIPPVSIADLGLIERVEIHDDRIEIDLLPTFSGCPALDVIRQDVEAAARAVSPGRDIRVRFVYSPPWTSDRITAIGREAMRAYGLTPPPAVRSGVTFVPLAALSRPEGLSPCPFCGGRDTVLESAFGPTLCRTTHFCRACRNPFEAFKQKTA